MLGGTCWVCSLPLCLLSLLKLSWERDQARTFSSSFESWIAPRIPNIRWPRENPWVLHAQAALTSSCLWLTVVIFSQSSSLALGFLSCFSRPRPSLSIDLHGQKDLDFTDQCPGKDSVYACQPLCWAGLWVLLLYLSQDPRVFSPWSFLNPWEVPHDSWCSLPLPGRHYSQGGHEQAYIIYLELKKTDIKQKWVLVHVRECDGRPCLRLA